MKKLPFLLLVIFSLSACSNFNYRSEIRNTFSPLGWIKYQENQTGERSGYQLVQAVLSVDKTLQDVLDVNGAPDYVRSNTYRRLDLAYLSKGEVHVFHVKTSLAPLMIDYQKFDDLSQSLVAEFKRYDKVKNKDNRQ
mgnify:CR=1 FL=1